MTEPAEQAEMARQEEQAGTTGPQFPQLVQTVLDCTNVRELAEFYRQMLGYQYRAGDEAPPAGEPDENGQSWLVLVSPDGERRLAFQHSDSLPEPTWPKGPHPQMLHLDLQLPDAGALNRQHTRVLNLGARLLMDRFDDPEEHVRVYADLAGHPFCLFAYRQPSE